jgi:hypothetical protein
MDLYSHRTYVYDYEPLLAKQKGSFSREKSPKTYEKYCFKKYLKTIIFDD